MWGRYDIHLFIFLTLIVKYLQLTKQSDAQSVEIMKDLNHIEIASTHIEQHLTEIITYVEDVIVSEVLNAK